jgi:uncharacterized protein (DUF1330 family)
MAEPRGYWIVRVDVQDEAAYGAYIAANGEAFAAYGARFLVRGGPFELVEGSARARNVVIEFPTHQAALDCYASPEYAAAKALRQGGSEADLIIIAGYDGPQPGA